MKAIYYDTFYYLIPEDFNDAGKFIKSLKPGETYRLTRLKEDNCIAPYFIKGNTEERNVTVDDPSAVYSAEVTLLDKDEYTRRLKEQASSYCEGCPRYKGDPTDELTLDGMCYEDEEDLKDQFKDKTDAFWKSFTAIEESLRSRIDAEDRAASKELEEELAFIGPVKVFFNRINGRYKLMISGLFDQDLSLLCDYLTQRAPEGLKEHWDVYGYLPQNVFKYVPTSEEISVYKNAPMIKFEVKKADRPRFDVTLMMKDHPGSEVDVFLENMLYVFSVMGENRFFASLSALSCDTDYDKTREGFVHVKDFSSEVQKYYMENYRSYFRRFHYGEVRVKADQCSGRRKDNQLLTTNCDKLSRILLSGDPKSLATLPKAMENIGTLTLDFGKSVMEYQKHLKPIHDLIETKLYNEGYIIPFSVCYGTTKVYVDFILTDLNRARRAVRDLTPMLQKYSAVYTETTPAGSNSYICDYELGIHEA